MTEPSKVTKVLVNKIHGGRKQDSKFWNSEFSEPKKEAVPQEPKKRGSFPESFILFVLFFIGIGVVSYGGFYMFKRYYTEFASPIEPINETAEISKRKPRQVAPSLDDKPITQKDLDRAIQKALAEQSRKNQRYTPPPKTDFYYLVELVDGVKIQAKSATQNGDHFTIKDRMGLEFSLKRKEIKSVKKVQI